TRAASREQERGLVALNTLARRRVADREAVADDALTWIGRAGVRRRDGRVLVRGARAAHAGAARCTRLARSTVAVVGARGVAAPLDADLVRAASERRPAVRGRDLGVHPVGHALEREVLVGPRRRRARLVTG